MKKSILMLFLLLICFALFLSGCTSYVAKKTYFSNVDDYSKIWTLTGFNHGYEEKNKFFPDTFENMKIDKFFCRYDEQYLLGEGIQVFLEISFEESSYFSIEEEKIKTMAFRCNEYFVESELSIYATKLGENSSSEYAFIDNQAQKIYYVYLQNVPRNEIEIQENFLPLKYEEYGTIN